MEPLSEIFLSRLAKQRLGPEVTTLAKLKSTLFSDLDATEDDLMAAASEAQKNDIIKIQNDSAPFLSVKNEREVGVQRLLRKFCKRYYGEVSPLIERKTIQAVLKRRGANFDLNDPDVEADIKAVEADGLVRIVNRQSAYLKLLGAE